MLFRALYSIGLAIYSFLIWFASSFNHKARLWIQGRRQQSLNTVVKKGKLAWFHCASTGEFEQGRPLMKELKERYNYTIVTSFFSPSGYQAKVNDPLVDFALYLPLDSAKNAIEFLDALNPDIVFFIKYEFWLFFFEEIKKRSIPFYVISAHFRKDQAFFKWYGKFYRTFLKYPTQIFVQTECSQLLLKKIGIRSEVTGDTRYDRVRDLRNLLYQNKAIETFKANRKLIVLGSTWLNDLEMLKPYISAVSSSELCFLIVPHELHDKHKMAKELNIEVSYYSNFSLETLSSSKVFIFDEMGHLSKIYRYADAVYIGGGFNKSGIHNTLEALVYGKLISFGPFYKKFNEAVELIQNDLAFEVKTKDDFNSFMDNWVLDPIIFNEKSKAIMDFMNQRYGATDRILREIDSVIQ